MPGNRSPISLATGLLWIATTWTAPPASADLGALDALVMPGKVIQKHAKFEAECRKCHVPFDKAAQSNLCLECHDHADVAADIRSRRGYHGRLADRTCNKCHVEHKGRDMNIVRLDKARFDHDLTDFALRGAHADAKVRCEDCHRPGRKHREAPAACYACHQKDDTHKGGLGRDCASCHTERNWKEVRFDHSKTGYPLEGKHRVVECKACHVNERYKETPKDCYSCHRKDDDRKGHKGRFGRKCETCHVTDDWKQLRFDHNRDTRYPLLGKHGDVRCTACHSGTLYQEKLATACIACHRKDDEHKGRFGRKCESCHVEKGWKVIVFNHDRDTRYPLRGKHKQIACGACHKGSLYQEKLASECLACHRKDDVHKGQEGKRCERCHNETSWKEKTFFDHGLSRFPLLGKHARVECKKCHSAQTFRDAPVGCVACHEKDDKHKRRLGAACEQCHDARDWKYWNFDHNKRTSFVLDGAHERLACDACHRQPVKKKISLAGSCVSCHEIEDVHRGVYGRACESCHVTSKWRTIRKGSRVFR